MCEIFFSSQRAAPWRKWALQTLALALTPFYSSQRLPRLYSAVSQPYLAGQLHPIFKWRSSRNSRLNPLSIQRDFSTILVYFIHLLMQASLKCRMKPDSLKSYRDADFATVDKCSIDEVTVQYEPAARLLEDYLEGDGTYVWVAKK